MDPAVQTTRPRLRHHRSSRRRGGAPNGAPPLRTLSEMLRAAAADGVIDPKHQDGADDRDQHAPDIESGDAARAENTKQRTHDHDSDNTEHYSHNDALPVADIDLARDEARDQAQHNPG